RVRTERDAGGLSGLDDLARSLSDAFAVELEVDLEIGHAEERDVEDAEDPFEGPVRDRRLDLADEQRWRRGGGIAERDGAVARNRVRQRDRATSPRRVPRRPDQPDDVVHAPHGREL